ncbi:histidine phosphatase superfamily [Penicillium odoratum]|uniref:histidine phosphatase superfamily n=1 Tax=Penicillium odoratum TaxID=1167516 RepID=UPI0025491327|nr:histidine phosphatase superfamily [Penicillium odoratum]KAJ5753066.1 histidine phosphatase superfamily [Penicillium odoratum]
MGEYMRIGGSPRKRWLTSASISAVFIFIILWTYANTWPYSSVGRLFGATPATPDKDCSSSPAPTPTGARFESGFDMTKSWAQLTPYKSADWGVPKGVPKGERSELSQVHILHRHAQRYPTGMPMDGQVIQKFTEKLNGSIEATGPLEFLNDWKYVVGLDELMRTGASTEATSGANFWLQYGRLLYRATPENVVAWNASLNVFPNGTARPKPFFRTTDQSRILESARWWLSGFFGDRGAHGSYDQYDLLVLPEQLLFNNTLASYYSCPGGPGDQSNGDETAKPFVARYLKDARSRLSAYLPPDFDLTTMDVLAMQTICVYEETSLAGSKFCSLFTEQEWKDFAYSLDIQYYGNYGFSSPVGRAQGIGYVMELAARLEEKLIPSSDTSLNSTYDNNVETFPLGQPFYMDMSHDNIIVSVMAALNLEYFKYSSETGLPGNVDHAPDHTFKVSDATPFGARFMTEMWTCPNDVTFDSLDPVLYSNPVLESTKDTTKYIRFLLNDSPLPLTGVIGCEDSTNGFCALDKFLSGIPELKKRANYREACFGYYLNHTEAPIDIPNRRRHFE